MRLAWLLIFQSIFYYVQFVIVISQQLKQGMVCLTPNNETALCIAVKKCTIITRAIASRNKTAIDFAVKSQCGYDVGPLVCCGTTSYPLPIHSRFTTTNITKIRIKPFIHNNLPHSSVCGVERTDHRIFGGKSTDLDEFPWASLLRYNNEIGQDIGFRCGGTLVNHKYVLTAAHCVTYLSGLELTSVRFGEWKISTSRDCIGENRFKECANPAVNVDVDITLPHPQYNKRLHVSDIALVRLKWNVRYTDFIRPICLPPPNLAAPSHGTKVFAVGWGATERGEASDIKQKVQLAIVSKQDYNRKMRNRTQINDKHICAGGAKGKDTCQGDSGGPLMLMVENVATSQPQWFQTGIISWGIGCGLDGYPGIYTKVSAFSNWIVSNMVFDDK